MALGVVQVVGTFYAPGAGAFLIYALIVVVLPVAPRGLVRRRR